MKVEKWLSNSMSAIIGYAIVRLEPGEVADVEQMLSLIDGDSVGHFGVMARLQSVDEPPKCTRKSNRPWYIHGTFGFDNASSLRQRVRFYEVMVNRD